MATVGRVTAPSVTPDALPGARVTGQLNPNFADGIARGVDKIGAAVQQIGEREIEKANTAQVLEARRKLSDWERTWFDPNNEQGIYSSKGRDALGLLDKVEPDFERVKSELMGGLRSDAARQAFDNYAAGQRDSILGRVNSYAVQEHDGYVKAEFKASIMTSTESAARAGSEGRYDDQAREVQFGLQTLRAQASALGEPAEATRVKELAFVSAVHATTVNAMLATGKYDDAFAYMDANAGEMDAETAAQVQARMRPLMVDNTVQALADGLGGSVSVLPGFTGADVGLDQIWGHQIQQESGNRQLDKNGNPITSSAGAIGVAQIMPDTGPVAAKYAGVPWDPERFKTDKAYNETLGKAYMSAQMTAFGSAPLALAAYNAGPGRVQQWIKRFGDPRKGEISVGAFVEKIPFSETKDYVTRILSKAGAQPAKAGAPAEPGVAAGMTFAQQMEATQSIPDKDVRRGLQAELRSRHAIAEESRRAQEAATLQRIHETIEAAPPGSNFTSVFGKDPDVVAFVTQNGMRDTVDGWLLNRTKRELTETNPLRFDYWDKLSTFEPSEFIKHEVGILADPELSTPDRRTLLARIAALRDPKKKDAAQHEWASDGERIDAAVHTLGWGNLTSKELTKRKSTLNAAYRQAEKAFIQTQEKKPTPEEKDALMSGVVRNYAKGMVDGKLPASEYKKIDKRVRAYDEAATVLPVSIRKQAAAGAQRVNGHPPSEAEMIAYAVEYGLLEDSQ